MEREIIITCNPAKLDPDNSPGIIEITMIGHTHKLQLGDETGTLVCFSDGTVLLIRWVGEYYQIIRTMVGSAKYSRDKAGDGCSDTVTLLIKTPAWVVCGNWMEKIE